MTTEKRELKFESPREVKAELARLQAGYKPGGNWNLAQTCDHLAYFIEGSLDGHQFKVPWIFKFLFGRMVLKRILGSGRMKAGVFTPQKPLPAPDIDLAKSVARLNTALDRLEAHQGELQDSPFFGHLTPDQWRQLHMIHCAHHLGNLQPG
ncbi:MAG: DUF1569 domain-containing protein [Gemmataceae bacterium]